MKVAFLSLVSHLGALSGEALACETLGSLSAHAGSIKKVVEVVVWGGRGGERKGENECVVMKETDVKKEKNEKRKKRPHTVCSHPKAAFFFASATIFSLSAAPHRLKKTLLGLG